MADSKSAGLGPCGFESHCEYKPDSSTRVWGPVPAYLPLLWWRESGPDLSVVNAPSGGCCQFPASASALVGRAARVVSCVWLVPSFVGAAF